MPDRLTDAEAEFLFDQANRRARLLGVVQKTLPRYWWLLSATQQTTSVFIVATLILMLGQVIFRETDLISSLLPLAVFSIICIAINVAILNKRMDALIELLREDGMLQSTPPVAKIPRKQ